MITLTLTLTLSRYIRFEDVGHSEDARDMLKEYLIGELPAEEKAKAEALRKEKAESGGGGGNM